MALFEEAIDHDPPTPTEALDYPEPSIMLRAMAVECLLKARAADRGMILAKDGRYVLKLPKVRDHDLVALAKAVDFEMTDREEFVLGRLARWITAGRYPIQKRWDDQVRVKDGMIEFLTVGWHPDWDDVFQDVIDRLTAA